MVANRVVIVISKRLHLFGIWRLITISGSTQCRKTTRRNALPRYSDIVVKLINFILTSPCEIKSATSGESTSGQRNRSEKDVGPSKLSSKLNPPRNVVEDSNKPIVQQNYPSRIDSIFSTEMSMKEFEETVTFTSSYARLLGFTRTMYMRIIADGDRLARKLTLKCYYTN